MALLMPLLSLPQAMVSNPHSLGLQAIIYEEDYTCDGSTKHRLVSHLLAPNQEPGQAQPPMVSPWA